MVSVLDAEELRGLQLPPPPVGQNSISFEGFLHIEAVVLAENSCSSLLLDNNELEKSSPILIVLVAHLSR